MNPRMEIPLALSNSPHIDIRNRVLSIRIAYFKKFLSNTNYVQDIKLKIFFFFWFSETNPARLGQPWIYWVNCRFNQTDCRFSQLFWHVLPFKIVFFEWKTDHFRKKSGFSGSQSQPRGRNTYLNFQIISFCDLSSPPLSALFCLKNFKGQIIFKCPFGVFKSSKKPTNFFQDFCPSL